MEELPQASTAPPAAIRLFSRQEVGDTVANAAAMTLAQGMGDDHTGLWCAYPERYVDDWLAEAINYQLRMPCTRFIYAMGPEEQPHCVAYAYWYPDDAPVLRDGEAEGSVDTSAWMRPESHELVEAITAFQARTKQEILQAHGPYLYLAFIGTPPERQGKGLGKAMLAHLCSLADARGVPVFLESSSDRNAALYQRQGFEFVPGMVQRFELPEVVPGVQLTLKGMIRMPRKAAAEPASA